MKNRIGKRTKNLTVGAMLSALGVVILAAGSLFDVLDLSAAAFASMLCIYAVIEMGGGYPWMIFGVTSFLSLILLPQKSPAVFYACFFGFFPIIKEKAERLRKPVAFLLKTLTAHICFGGIYLVFRFFIPSALETYEWRWMYLLFYAALLICFYLYDFCLTRLIGFYLYRLRGRLRPR